MKFTTTKWKLFFVLFAPLFMYGLCSHDNDDLTLPNTDQYITWQIPGHSGQITAPPDTIGMVYYNNQTLIYGANTSSPFANFYVSFSGPQTPGNYTTQDVLIYSGSNYYVQTAPALNVHVTEYGSIGGYLVGSYSGTIKDSMSTTTYTISGNFRVKSQ